MGGIARSRALCDAGLSKHDIAAAVAAGRLVRERRVWVALPDADPSLRQAARGGVILSCITAAGKLGLWSGTDARVHVACHPHSGMAGLPGAVLHRHAPLVPRDPAALSDGVTNALHAVALCQPFEQAVAVWDSALNKGLVDIQSLRRLPLPQRATRVLDAASPFRDSGLESFVPVRLRWLRLPIRSQAWLYGHRVDFLIGERLVLQVDGGHHVGMQRTSDIEHDALLLLHGFHVIRVGYDQIVNRWAEVQELVLAAVAQGLHRD